MANYRQFNSDELSLKEKHQLLLASVAPRPIGFTASKSIDGSINLAPFSYHNAFSSNPPVVGISPAYSGRTGEPKNTLTNILATKEFTLSVVTYDMVEQMNICAAEYGSDVDEFKKSGLSRHPSKSISIPGVAESPLIMECRFLQHIQFSSEPAGGNLLLGEIIYFHARDDIYNKAGQIDPKKVELSSYHSLVGYHLITAPNIEEYVMTTPENAVGILDSAINEMERRFDIFSENRVRNISEYQKKCINNGKLEKIPYIVVLIDELADLMMTSNVVEHLIVRIAQKARAIGIHLILSTQRPEAKVVTGLIKSNMPCRVAFKVSSGMDSRIVLDSKGAELLLGNGDMLYISPSSTQAFRAQGTFVSPKEIRLIAKHLKEVAAPNFEPSLVFLRLNRDSIMRVFKERRLQNRLKKKLKLEKLRLI